ncbi:hypothetical protein [Dactylosporangium sp. NPDC050588]|uniref:hypothetical protein n=1 Tax=Dactylosporangium sp. NPDC050588 TaxID=3157211 RepID=UPI0033EB1373
MGSWTRRVVAVAVVAISAIAVTAAPAGAVTPVGAWKGNTYWASDIVGAHAQGDSYVSGGRVYVTGYIRDTASDGHGACLKIKTWYNDSVFTRDEFVSDTDGNNSSYKYFSFNYPVGTTEYIDIQECLTESGSIWDEAPGWQAIVSP